MSEILITDTTASTVDFDRLACPYCHDGFLHQRGVEVFFRTIEDSETGLYVSVDSNCNFAKDHSMAGNPSFRRDGILIHFECEICPPNKNRHTLSVIQHKGSTLVRWEA